MLAVLSSQALADQRTELLAAQRRSALARTTQYEREKTLWEEKISPEQDMLQGARRDAGSRDRCAGARQKLATLGSAPGGDGA